MNKLKIAFHSSSLQSHLLGYTHKGILIGRKEVLYSVVRLQKRCAYESATNPSADGRLTGRRAQIEIRYLGREGTEPSHKQRFSMYPYQLLLRDISCAVCHCRRN
ncbi:hypothetical protein NPIL_303841 [Nephila pilipes]|uniref:Uncharacterized protein n=1 Tax=Nephila pilipes TaxID=299642 RepID=A0A8X6TEU3_NEPPI|nr:hypothetical protein NPIL_303841 [Nephila pilipes]